MTRGFAADYVVPVVGPTLAPGWIAFDAGEIAAIGRGEPPPGFKGERLPKGAAVFPGFVNAHAHLALGGLHGVADDRPFLDWIDRGILPAVVERANDAAFFEEGAARDVDLLLRSGCTTIADVFLRAEGVAALRARGVRGVFFQEVFGGIAEDEDAYWRETEAALDRLPAALSDFPFGYSPHASWTCPKKTLARVVERAKREGRRTTFHLAESLEEHLLFAERRGPLYEAFERRGTLDRFDLGRTPTAAFDAVGALHQDALLVHGVHLTDDDVARIAARGASVVHCPSSNLKLAEGFAPVAKLLDAGVVVALGTDSAASSERRDMFEEMRLFSLLGRGSSGRVGPFGAASALRAATVSGARALGLSDKVGALARGLRADAIVVDLSRALSGRARDPVDALVWGCGPCDVRRVVVDGVERLRVEDAA
jgi:5-methylthioadenosine/S-adenosylhomocysteine deaminase